MTLTLDQLFGTDALLTDEERQVQRSVRKFVQRAVLPRIPADFEAGRFDRELIPQLATLGLFGAPLTGYGCAGMGSVAWGLACAELEAGDSGLRSFVSVQTSLAMFAIWRFGSEAQKERWLPAMAEGRAIGCFGLTEPDHGSDPGSMETRARRDGDAWIVSGNKLWITNAQMADVAIVWARTGESADSIAGFLVERGQPGFSATSIPHKLSMRASVTGGLVLEDVRVPEAARLPEAHGLRAPLTCLDSARFGVGFGVLGAARFCLETAIAYAGERKQFGVPLAQKQLVQAELASMAGELAKCFALAVHFGRLKEKDALHPVQTSLFKRESCRVALDIARRCRALLGANGVSGDYHVLRHALNLESTATYEGTDFIHALAVGRALTGLAAF